MNTSPLRMLRRLPTSAAAADTQLAAGLAMLDGLADTQQPSLRWYRIDPPALLLGSAQKPLDVNLATSAAAGVAVYRRASGGGAVYSGSALSLDIALPPGDPSYVADVTESYRWLGEVWVAALGEFGIAARVVGIAEARADAAILSPLLKRVCFGGLSPYEVVVDGRKVVGLAQRRRMSGTLLQAGVYFDWHSADTASLVATDEERATLIELLDRRVVGLHDLVQTTLTDEVVIQAFETALTHHTGLTPTDDTWRTQEKAAATKYSNFRLPGA